MNSFMLVTALTLISIGTANAENFSKVECKFRGNHEIQEKKFLSSNYKTIYRNFVEYSPLGSVQFDLNEPRNYGYFTSGFFGGFSINFDLKKISDEEFYFLITSKGKEITTIPFNINDTITPDNDWLSTIEPKVFLITGENGKKRAVLTELVASCKRIR